MYLGAEPHLVQTRHQHTSRHPHGFLHILHLKACKGGRTDGHIEQDQGKLWKI